MTFWKTVGAVITAHVIMTVVLYAPIIIILTLAK